jgi:hypothetical protein
MSLIWQSPCVQGSTVIVQESGIACGADRDCRYDIMMVMLHPISTLLLCVNGLFCPTLRVQARFWTEIYDGAKLFYLSGVQHGG